MKNPPKEKLAGGCVEERRSQNFVKKSTASPKVSDYSNVADLAVIVKIGNPYVMAGVWGISLHRPRRKKQIVSQG